MIQKTYGTDVLLSKKQLSISAPEFIGLLGQRVDAVKHEASKAIA